MFLRARETTSFVRKKLFKKRDKKKYYYNFSTVLKSVH